MWLVESFSSQLAGSWNKEPNHSLPKIKSSSRPSMGTHGTAIRQRVRIHVGRLGKDCVTCTKWLRVQAITW